jgi:pyruvate/2-oxoglutarate dehydrogenase complex dihydrolipoamide acyltransferase (E2) component
MPKQQHRGVYRDRPYETEFTSVSGQEEADALIRVGKKILGYPPLEEGDIEKCRKALKKDPALALYSDYDSAAEERPVKATSAARELAEEHSLDLRDVLPTGRNGDVTVHDVAKLLKELEEVKAYLKS